MVKRTSVSFNCSKVISIFAFEYFIVVIFPVIGCLVSIAINVRMRMLIIEASTRIFDLSIILGCLEFDDVFVFEFVLEPNTLAAEF